MIGPENLDSRKGAKAQKTNRYFEAPHTQLRMAIGSRRDAETAELQHSDFLCCLCASARQSFFLFPLRLSAFARNSYLFGCGWVVRPGGVPI